LPSGRGTTVVTSDHDGVAIAAGDAAAVVAAAELSPEAKEPRRTQLRCESHLGITIWRPEFSHFHKAYFQDKKW
jgi:hypothetical protein